MWKKEAKINSEYVIGDMELSYDGNLKIYVYASILKPLERTDVIKIHLCSGTNPDIPSINGGLAEVVDGKFTLSKVISLPPGILPHHIDRAEIVEKNVFTEECKVLCRVEFSKEDDNSDLLMQKLNYLKENQAYRQYLDEAENLSTPLENGAMALERLKEVLSKDIPQNAHILHMEKAKATAEKFAISNDGMPKGYIWHRINTLAPLFETTGFYHILSSDGVFQSFQKFYHYFVGIGQDCNIVCIAIPVDSADICPLPHVQDCCVYIKGKMCSYCTVCISFEPDGQYFMPLY